MSEKHLLGKVHPVLNDDVVYHVRKVLYINEMDEKKLEEMLKKDPKSIIKLTVLLDSSVTPAHFLSHNLFVPKGLIVSKSVYDVINTEVNLNYFHVIDMTAVWKDR